MKERIEEIRRETAAGIENATDLKALEALRVAALGRKGKLTEILRGLAQASPEERKEIGRLANELKEEMAAALDARKAALEAERCHRFVEERRLEAFLALGQSEGVVEFLEVARRNVKADERVVQTPRVEVIDHQLEMSQDIARLVGVLDALHLAIGMRGRNKRDGAPVLALGVNHEVLPILSGNHARKLPDAVGGRGLLLETLVRVVGQDAHVLHDVFGPREHAPVNPLEDETLLGERRAENRQIRVVDVAVAGMFDGDNTTRYVELRCNERCFHG